MRRGWAMAAAMLLAGGCGLVLDLQPPDPDAARPGMDAAVLDAGEVDRDGGARDDAGAFDAGVLDGGAGDAAVDGGLPRVDAAARDAGLDAGADAGPVENCEAICTTPGFYCERPAGRCVGPARCVPIPSSPTCLPVEVCGCDRNTYPDACSARALGVNVATTGACPSFSAFDWCPLAEPPAAPGGCHPCFDEDDCLDIPFGTEWVCVGSACAVGGEGSCQPRGSLSDCYYDYQCDPGETCTDPEIRQCVGSEFLLQGRCR